MLPWFEGRLVLLPVVFRSWLRTVGDAKAVRQAIRSAMWQSKVQPQRFDAIHAILSVVPSIREEEMEDRRRVGNVQTLWTRGIAQFLDLLPLVRKTTREIVLAEPSSFRGHPWIRP
jgi:hypothetical protein